MHFNDTTSPGKGQHLTLSELIEIQLLKQLSKSDRAIVTKLGRSNSMTNDTIKRVTSVQKKFVNNEAIY